MTLWYQLVFAPAGPAAEAVRVFAQGDHLGEAIDGALGRLGKHGRSGLWPVEAVPLSTGEAPRGEELGRGVLLDPAPAAWPAVAPRDFRCPFGVVLGEAPDAAPAVTLYAGYTVSRHEGTWAVEAVVDGTRLDETFLSLIERLPSGDNIEVRLLGHYEDFGRTDVWLSPRFPRQDRLTAFLDDLDVDLLHNGHVELNVYMRAEHSTLRLTDHKTIILLTESEELRDQFTAWLVEEEVPPVQALGNIDAGHPHYHWRPAASHDRDKLAKRLERARLRKVDSWPSGA
jgi:hypothetical protein